MSYLTGIVLIAVDIFPAGKSADYRNPSIFNELSDYFFNYYPAIRPISCAE
jgi:hypothetical protein